MVECCHLHHAGTSHRSDWKGELLIMITDSYPFPFLNHHRDGADSDQRRREEDFYYTEVQVKEEAAPESATSPTFGSSPIVIQQALAKPEALALDQATLESHLPNSALSQSAPSSFWHIQADHAYQVCWPLTETS